MKKRKLFKVVCANCGSEDCGQDAYSAWDVDLQEDVLGATYDAAWCSNCGDDADPQAVPLTRREIAERKARLAEHPNNLPRFGSKRHVYDNSYLLEVANDLIDEALEDAGKNGMPRVTSAVLRTRLKHGELSAGIMEDCHE